MSKGTPIIKAGHEFHGPDGQGYRITRDIYGSEPIRAEQFQPFGGAPKAKVGERTPLWLARQLKQFMN